jgi:catechol 2,3-dioxygenase-like lactoylglutathione lyase family enzyme
MAPGRKSASNRAPTHDPGPSNDPRPGPVNDLRADRVLETALYVEDLERSAAFYERVLGLRVMSRASRLVSVDAGGGTVLLLFLRGGSTEGTTFPGGWIPPHDATGRGHVAFAIGSATLDQWRARLAEEGVALESEVTWGRGGTSLYFRDPDGHSIELATPGVWEVY